MGTVVPLGEVVWVDLKASFDELWRQTRSDHRRNINKAKRLGHRALVDTEWRHFDELCSIYSETMDRVSASTRYRFGASYFTKLREILGARLSLVVVEIEGEIACAGLFTACSGIVQFHLSGTKTAFLRHRPSKLMLDFVRNWAKDQGHDQFHLGGGVGGANDALFAFKRGFSHLRAPLYSWRVVVDEPVYRDLVRRLSPWADPADRSSFFPTYRAPSPTSNSP